MMPITTSAILVGYLSGIAAGDARALTALHQATSSKLYATIDLILHDEMESDDILQETYLKVWLKAGRYRADMSTPMSWLMKIAKHAAIDRRRVLARRWLTLDEPAMQALPDPSPCPLGQLERAQRASVLGSMLLRLSPRAASAIKMAFYEDLTYAQVARRLGLAEGTTKSLIRRGLSTLRPLAPAL